MGAKAPPLAPHTQHTHTQGSRCDVKGIRTLLRAAIAFVLTMAWAIYGSLWPLLLVAVGLSVLGLR